MKDDEKPVIWKDIERHQDVNYPEVDFNAWKRGNVLRLLKFMFGAWPENCTSPSHLRAHLQFGMQPETVSSVPQTRLLYDRLSDDERVLFCAVLWGVGYAQLADDLSGTKFWSQLASVRHPGMRKDIAATIALFA